MYGVLYSAVFFIFRTIQKYKIQRLFIPRCSWREPLSERVTRQIRAKPCTPAPKIGYGVLVCLRRKQPNTLRLTSRAFRGINRRCRYTFIAGQGKKKSPNRTPFQVFDLGFYWCTVRNTAVSQPSVVSLGRVQPAADTRAYAACSRSAFKFL